MAGNVCGDGASVAAGLTAVGVLVDSVGQADDVVLVSNSIHHLRNLVKLTKNYCDSFHVTLGQIKQNYWHLEIYCHSRFTTINLQTT